MVAGGEMIWALFGIRILPFTLLALAATGFGMRVLSPHVTPAMRLPAVILVLLAFIAYLTFRQSKAWSLALLIGLTMGAGCLLSEISALHTGAWAKPLGLAALVVSVAALISRALRDRLAWAGAGFYALSWVYLLGWPVLNLLQVSRLITTCWALGGVVIFAGLACFWFSALPRRVETSTGPSLAGDLYLLLFNLSLGIGVMLEGLPAA